MVAAVKSSPYFTPYTFVLGVIATVTGWSGISVVTAAAPVCVALIFYGLWRFSRIFTADPWSPVVSIALLLLLWGANAPAWSGFLNLRGLPLIMPYPSTVAIGLTLLWWALVWKAFETARFRIWLMVGLGLGVAGAADQLDAIHRPLFTDLPKIYGFALVLILPAIATRLRRDRLDPLAWLFVLSSAIVGVGWATERWAMGRVLPLMMLAGQLALAIELVAFCRKPPTSRHGIMRPALAHRRSMLIGVWLTAALAASLGGFWIQRDTLLSVLPPHRATPAFAEKASWITDRVKSGEVLLTDHKWVSRDLLGHGILFVAPPWPDPTLVDERQRRDDLLELTATTTPEWRRTELSETPPRPLGSRHPRRVAFGPSPTRSRSSKARPGKGSFALNEPTVP